MGKSSIPVVSRPMPPKELGHYGADFPVMFMPALDMPLWVRDTFLDPNSKLFNQDHYHLFDHMEGMHIGFLWAASSYESKGRVILGLTEETVFRSHKWAKWRQEMQMQEWFGLEFPGYLITLSGPYCEAATHEEFCALVEHELYHIGHAKDKQGLPAFNKDTGLPSLTMRGHDVEEFVGVVRRYGAGNSEGALAQLIEAGKGKPEISRVDIAACCGTCLKLAA